MHLFVTGAGSFIGNALIAAADARGIRVSGIDLVPPARPGCVAGDIRDAALAAQIPEGVDAVVHLAAVSRDSDSRGKASACFDINVMGTLNVIAAARACGAKQIVFASSEWVYDGMPGDAARREDDPLDAARMTSEYALSKYVSETNLRQAFAQGLCPVTVLRFGIVYGPRLKNWSAVEALAHAAATKDEVHIGARATARRYIHVADIADGIFAAIGCDGFEIVNIQGPRLVSLGEIVDTAARLAGKSPAIVETDAARPSIRRVADDKARSLLGWQAKIAIERGIETVLAELQVAS